MSKSDFNQLTDFPEDAETFPIRLLLHAQRKLLPQLEDAEKVRDVDRVLTVGLVALSALANGSY